jgi:hypothetical protein
MKARKKMARAEEGYRIWLLTCMAASRIISHRMAKIIMKYRKVSKAAKNNMSKKWRHHHHENVNGRRP